ncbi:MAG: N-acetylmuramoyl-L-alanine amidase [Verrucomicrobiae bacterium]|nr:N-acetylmuramoyl-L-alanine amidase [Verrucomicrobiae bacterium]
MKSLLIPSLLATGLILSPAFAHAGWDTTKKIADREHVALDEVAAAFDMKRAAARKDVLEIAYTGEAHQLIVKITTREAIIDGVRHWLSFPVQSVSGEPFVAEIDIDTALRPAFDPLSVKLPGPVRTVVFDPGHGGHDKGCRSPYGYEKDYTLDVVNRTRRILEKRKVKCVQSRLSDFFATLSERPAMTKNYEDPIFVSIHFNSADWRPSANGIEIYAIPPQGCPTTGKKPDLVLDRRDSEGADVEPASYALANAILPTLLGKMGSFDRGVKRARYAVLRHCEVPSVLIECGFLTNPVEAKKVDTPEWREKFAESLADGIEAYIALAGSQKAPPGLSDFDRPATDAFVTEM